MTGAWGPRVAVAALALAAFCFGSTESMPIGLLPLISDGLHVSASAVGLLVTGYAVAVAIGLLASLAGLRRVVAVDPALAFGGP